MVEVVWWWCDSRICTKDKDTTGNPRINTTQHNTTWHDTTQSIFPASRPRPAPPTDLPVLKNLGASSTSHLGSTCMTERMYSLVVSTSSW